MKLDHFCFIVLLGTMLLAPKLSLSFAELASKSGLAMGIFGLLFWIIVRPGYLLRKKGWRYPFIVKWLIVFSVYSLGISLLSQTMMSVAYAGQYFCYIWFSAFVLGNYLKKAAGMGQIHVVYKIIAWIGLIYALGVIISLWTGPFYTSQTMDYGRLWGGVAIQQGVGFAEGTNSAGSILIIFCAFYLFIYKSWDKRAWVFTFVAFLALLATISRSAIGSFLSGLGLWLSLEVFRLLIQKKAASRASRFFAKIGVLVVLLAVVFSFSFSLSGSESFNVILHSVASGFGFGGDSDVIGTDLSTRVSLWQSGLDLWTNGSIFEQFFGLGFRGSFTLGGGGMVWITPHNAYIAMLADFGLLGALIFSVSLILDILKSIFKYLKCGWGEAERGAFVIMVGVMIHNMTEVFFYSPILMCMLVLVFNIRDYGDSASSKQQNNKDNGLHKEELPQFGIPKKSCNE